jgi:predicted lipoprotein with Yx(FWY)xxD motif
VNLAETSLGTILVDGAGKTLYVFTPDTAGGISTCYDDCATAWPPLAADAVPTPGTGLDAGDFALVDRTDGSKQVTFHGMPLYYFASDAAAGDTKGQGLGEKWYVVDADGKLIK